MIIWYKVPYNHPFLDVYRVQSTAKTYFSEHTQ
jgi:hypothetical protein